VQDLPLRRGKVESLCGLLVYYTLVESGLKVTSRITPLVTVLNIFLKRNFFFALHFTAVGQNAIVVSCQLQAGVYTE
jgi:hypothetical protein